MLFEATVSMVDKMKKQILNRKKKRKISVGVLQRPTFLSEGSRLLEKLDLSVNFPSKKRCHIGNHVVFPTMLEGLHWRSHGCNVNPNE
jgi:hypothetical protein